MLLPRLVSFVTLQVFFGLANSAVDGTPQTVQWSSRAYGPDGPWQAVSVTMGTPPQAIDLLPGGSWMTNVLAPSVCVNGVPCDVATQAGFYNRADSRTDFAIGQTGNITNSAMFPTVGALPQLTGSAEWIFDTITIPMLNGAAGNRYTAVVENFDVLVISGANEKLPDGTTYPVQIGKLALGAPNANQTWLHFPPNPNWNGTLLTSAMLRQGSTQSNSYGMHVGSAKMNIPGSLMIGGFDQSRVLGPVSSQAYAIDHLPIDLLDIGIGVAVGDSPFPKTSYSGLLGEGNSSIGVAVSVFVEAPIPYIYLPQSACDAITQHLPVKFQKKYGLYFWDDQNPDYKRIVSSPSFLSFTFRLSGSPTQNMTINVPFALLNLTLSSPIVDTPTQYLPLRPSQGPNGNYALGRAFLQAAFIGVNWQTAGGDGDGVWFLAQAPGPNVASLGKAMSIGPSDTSIIGSTNSWADTWRGILTPLVASGGPSGTSNTNSSTWLTQPIDTASAPKKVLAKGVIIGIAIGGVAFLLIVALAIVLLRRRSRQAKLDTSPASSSGIEAHDYQGGQHLPTYRNDYKHSGYGPSEMESSRRVAEMAG